MTDELLAMYQLPMGLKRWWYVTYGSMNPTFLDMIDIVDSQFPDNIIILFALQPVQAVSAP
jgi:hypothetical protein